MNEMTTHAAADGAADWAAQERRLRELEDVVEFLTTSWVERDTPRRTRMVDVTAVPALAEAIVRDVTEVFSDPALEALAGPVRSGIEANRQALCVPLRAIAPLVAEVRETRAGKVGSREFVRATRSLDGTVEVLWADETGEEGSVREAAWSSVGGWRPSALRAQDVTQEAARAAVREARTEASRIMADRLRIYGGLLPGWVRICLRTDGVEQIMPEVCWSGGSYRSAYESSWAREQTADDLPHDRIGFLAGTRILRERWSGDAVGLVEVDTDEDRHAHNALTLKEAVLFAIHRWPVVFLEPEQLRRRLESVRTVRADASVAGSWASRGP